MATAKKRPGKSMDDTDVPGGRANRKKPGDLVDMMEFPPKKWVRVRLFGEVFAYGGYWVTTKKRDGAKAQFFTPCVSFDPETALRDTTKEDPWGEHEGQEVRFTTDYFMNGISRVLQKRFSGVEQELTESEAETGFKEKSSDSETPVRAVRMGPGLMRQVKELKDLNVHEDDKGRSTAYGVSHPKYGCDIMIRYNPDNPPATKWSVQKSDAAPLKKSEKSYLTYDLSDLQDVPDLAEQKREYASWAERMGLVKPTKGKGKAADEDDEDDDEPVKKSKKRPLDDDEEDDDEPPVKKKGKAKPVDEEDEDEDDDDPPPKKVVKKKAKPVEEDEDEDEDDDPPPKKKVRKGPPVIDDDDLDEDDDEPPPKKKGKAKPVDEDEDEDDDPPPKKVVKKKAKPVEEDEDEDDDPPPKKKTKAKPVEDDDEDDDPPPKKKVAAKSKSKKPVDEDDEDDDDIPY